MLPTDREPVTSDADRRVTLTDRDTKSLNVLWQLSGQNGSMVPADDWFRAVVAAGVLKPGASDDASRKVFQRTATALRKAKLVNVERQDAGNAVFAPVDRRRAGVNCNMNCDTNCDKCRCRYCPGTNCDKGVYRPPLVVAIDRNRIRHFCDK